jgi:predicted ester cyclase
MPDCSTTGDISHTARRLIEVGFAGPDHAVIDELIGTASIEHQRGHGQGAAGAHELVSRLHHQLSDLRFDIQDIAVAGDRVWMRMRVSGTNTGPVMGHPPIGRQVAIDVFDVVRVADGRIVEHWGVADQMGLLLQVGAVPDPVFAEPVG